MNADAEFGIGACHFQGRAKARPLASREVLVTRPLRWASAMPRLTPSVQPRSSALTIRFFKLRGSPVPRASYFFRRCAIFVPLTEIPTHFSMTC